MAGQGTGAFTRRAASLGSDGGRMQRSELSRQDVAGVAAACGREGREALRGQRSDGPAVGRARAKRSPAQPAPTPFPRFW
jgi:hypothetical protein